MHIVACQIDIAWEDRYANHLYIQSLLESQAIPAGSLIVLPEMFASGFSMDVQAICDSGQTSRGKHLGHSGDPLPGKPGGADGSSLEVLAEVARRYHSVVLGGVVTRDADDMGRNRAVAFGPDGACLVNYTKMHPFTFAGEDKRYRAGDSVVTFEHGGFTIAPLICYDLRFPERFREAVRLGAQVLVVIANWPSSRAEHWSALLAARAIENQAYVVGVNRFGRDPNHSYPGLSVVIDPQGKVITQAGDQAAVLHADMDLDALRAYRLAFPVLYDMRDV